MTSRTEWNDRVGSLQTGVAVGFATSVGMWFIGFATHLPGVVVPGMVSGLLLIAAQLAGGAVAGRTVPVGHAWQTGATAGVVSGVLNLLIVGAVVASEEGGDLRPGWVVIALGTIGFGLVVGAAGGFLGGRIMGGGERTADTRRNLGLFGAVAAAAALPVLLSGGIVTSAKAGLAVPDWPTSYGANMFLFPLSKMTGGIYYEHSHRLFGSLAGLTTLALMIFVLAADRRRIAKAMAAAAFVLVCVQGYMGGQRVVSATPIGGADSPELLADNPASLALAVIHGMTGQVFFAYLCLLAAVLGPSWMHAQAARDRRLSVLSTALLAALVVQLGLGATARHLHHGHAVMSHVGFALVVAVLAALTGFRAAKHRDVPALRRLGHGVLHTTGLQVVLGVLTFLLVLPYQAGRSDDPAAVITATAHQAVGALLLGLSATLAGWAWRRG